MSSAPSVSYGVWRRVLQWSVGVVDGRVVGGQGGQADGRNGQAGGGTVRRAVTRAAGGADRVGGRKGRDGAAGRTCRAGGRRGGRAVGQLAPAVLASGPTALLIRRMSE